MNFDKSLNNAMMSNREKLTEKDKRVTKERGAQDE